MTKIEWTDETWNPVCGNSDYLVSNCGRIKSFKQNEAYILKPMKSDSGHLYVFLYDGKGNSKKTYIHRVVLEAFVGPPGHDQETRHLDGNQENNKLSNLRWGTRQENANDRRRHGTMPIPHESKSTKLVPNDIPVIRRLQGEKSSREAADMFSTSHTTILKIWRGERWRDY